MRIILIFILLLISTSIIAANQVKSPASAMETAKKFVEEGKSKKALDILLQHNPSKGELSQYHYLYGKALALTGKPLDSIEHFRLAYIHAAPGKIKELALIERAEAYKKLGFHSEASVCLKLFLNVFPNSDLSKRVHLELADFLYKLFSFEEAIEHYEKAGNTYPAMYGKANSLELMGKTEEAYELYMSLISENVEYLKRSYETQYNIGENLRRMGKIEDAKIYLNSLMKDLTDPSIARKTEVSLGLIELEEKNPDSAITLFNSALQSEEKQVKRQALLHIAEAYMEMKRKEDATSALLEIKNNYPYGKEYDKAMLALARIYREDGRSDEAIALVKELIFRASPEPGAKDELQTILLDTEEDEKLLQLWNTNGRFLMEPSRSELLVQVADRLKDDGKPFMELCLWLLENGAYDAKVRCRLYVADFLADIGNATLASKYIDGIYTEERAKTRELDSQYQNAFPVIKLLMDMGAIPLIPKDIERIANSYKELNSIGSIAAYGDDIIRIRAKIYNLNSEYEKSFKEISSIKNMKTEDITFLSGALRTLKNEEIIKFYEKALNKFKGPMSAYVALADTLYQTGRKQDAVKYYKVVASTKASEDKNEGTIKDVDWANYMISKISDEGNKPKQALSKTGDGTLLGRLGEIGLKEIEIAEKIKGEF